MFSNTSYFKLYININSINNIIYSELLRTIVLELLGSFVDKRSLKVPELLRTRILKVPEVLRTRIPKVLELLGSWFSNVLELVGSFCPQTTHKFYNYSSQKFSKVLKMGMCRVKANLY